MNKLEMSNLPWLNVEEGIQRLRETGNLEWIFHLRPTHPHREEPEDTPFTNTLRNEFVRGALASLKNSLTTLLCKTDFMFVQRTTAPQLKNLHSWVNWISG